MLLRVVLLWVTWVFMPLPLWSATITGQVTLEAGSGLSKPPHAGGILVYVTGFQEKALPEEAILRQKNKTFWPKILPIVKGQSVVFPNLDKIYHNVFSVSSITSFNLGQYRAGEEPKSILFDQTGLIPVFCNIHPHMVSYIAVLENRAFALTEPSGSFRIENVPNGHYQLHAWQEGATRKTIDLHIDGRDISEAITLQLTQKRQKHKRLDNTDYPSDGFVYDE